MKTYIYSHIPLDSDFSFPPQSLSKMSLKVTNISSAFRPFGILLKCLGLLPLFQKPNEQWKQLVNWTIFGVMISLYCISYITLYERFIAYHYQWIQYITGNITICSVFVQPILSITVGSVVNGKYFNIFRLLEHFDKMLLVLSHRKQNHKMLQLMIALMFSGFTVIYMILLLLNLEIYFDRNTFQFMISFYNGLHLIAVSVQFSTITWTVFSRFQLLNLCLRMYFPVNSTPNGFSTSPGYLEMVVCNEKEQLVALRQIKVLHDKLNDVVELVNYCFAVQITFCVGLCFVIGVVCSFGLFKTLLYWDELYYMGLLNFVWYLYYLFFVLFFIAIGSKVTREGKQMGILVHKAINCSTSSVVINELNIFSQQLLHRSPVITCGLFVYDWTLLYTMIGATATYLIILIQFDVSFPSPTSLNDTVPYKG
uniref:gustatory receptor 60 isoform Gr60b n=1 Tax=Aedes aegypti TaxID=7159 RepID=UPI000C2539AE|nr:gustatory receptor 60 isoform Gr60b [Aedes aegypti]